MEIESFVGKTVSHFEIIEEVGAGGMGVVYKALDLRLGRLVALKFLSPRLLPSAAALDRFEREARAISALSHSNIAVLYDIGWQERQPYMVLEYLAGGSLRERIKDRRLSFAEICAYANQIGDGLQHAHSHQIVHRDVKPGNVMFSEDGTLKLLDFGLAKFRDGSEITREGTLLGTVAYMSPEQVKGAAVDHRADIFSFGVMLYEFAAGRLPFESEDAESLIYRLLKVDAPPISSARPDLPANLTHIVARALDKVPERRYQSVRELLGDLERTSSMEVCRSAVTVTLLKGSPKQRHSPLRTVWLLAALAAVLIVAVVLGVGWLAAPGIRMPVKSWLGIAAIPAHKQLIVLPFENVGGDAANQAFCDGLLETMTSTISASEAFQQSFWVVPASEVRRSATRSIQEARRTFNVNLAITGSVIRSGTDVQVTINLSDATTARQLAARLIQFSHEDVARLQTALLSNVSDLLQVQMQSRRLADTAGTDNSRAYNLYLEGQGYLRRFDGPPSIEKAITILERAVQLDSSYALARASLAEGYYRKFKQTKEAEWLARADSEGARAAALKGRFPQLYTTLGLIARGTGRYDQAATEFRKAIDIDPANWEAQRMLALTLEDQGRPSDAEQVYLTAIRQKPSYWPTARSLGLFYRNRGLYAKAEEWLKLVTKLAPENASGFLNLAVNYYSMRRYDKAVPALMKSIELRPLPEAYTDLGTIQFFQQHYAASVSSFEKAVELGPNDPYNWGNLADAYRQIPAQRQKSAVAYEKAIWIANQQLSINPNDADMRSSLAVYLAKTGKKPESLAELSRVLSLKPTAVNITFKVALVYNLNGDRTKAIQYLRDALEHGYSVDEVRHTPDLDNLRNEPGIVRLLSLTPTP